MLQKHSENYLKTYTINMKLLRHELTLVSESAPKGSHKKVAKKLGYSEQYIGQIRKGTNLTNDTPENRKLIQDCINEYRKLINKEIQKLSKL